MINISKNKCVGCGICITYCPVDAIFINNGVAEVDHDKCIFCRSCIEECPQNAIREILEELSFAIGTDDGERIKSDDHVGMSRYFQVLKYSGGKFHLEEKRENSKYKEDEARIHGDPGKAKATASSLKNIDVLVGKMFGPNIKRLKNRFVCAVIREESIEEAIQIIEENINEIIEEKNKEEKTGIILN
jgi:NAD-dependent dihydropyrimidine dehydrogenase PreA subunit